PNVDTDKSLSDNIEHLGAVLGEVSGSTTHYGAAATDVAGKLSALDGAVYSNAGAIEGLNNSLGEISESKGNIKKAAFSAENTVADNLMSLDSAISNIGLTLGEYVSEMSHDIIDISEEGTVKGNLQLLDKAASDNGKAIGSYTAGRRANNIDVADSLSQNIEALDEVIGKVSSLGIGKYNLSNGGMEATDAPSTIVEALQNIDASIGQVHGLASKLGNNYNGNLASGTTVEEHLIELDKVIGNRATVSNTLSVKADYRAKAMQENSVAESLSRLATNIGTEEQLETSVSGGLRTSNTVNQNLSALNKIIEDVSGSAEEAIEGLKTLVGSKPAAWESGTDTVIGHLQAAENKIGNAEFNTSNGNFSNQTEDLTMAVNALDNVVGRVSQFKDEHYTGYAKGANDLATAIQKVDATSKSNIEENARAISAETARAQEVEGKLSSLTTDAKDNLVAAINEVDKNIDDEIERAQKAEGNVGVFKTDEYDASYAAYGAKDLTEAVTKVDALASATKVNLGEISESKGNIKKAAFSVENTVADNLMSLDDIIGNVKDLSIAGEDVAGKLSTLDSKIDSSSSTAENNAKKYTDDRLSGEYVDATGATIKDMVIGNKADHISVGKTAANAISGEEELVAGLQIDNVKEDIELLLADNNTKRETSIKLDNGDINNDLQTIVIGSKDTYNDHIFGITITSDFRNNGTDKSKVSIGDGEKEVTISDGNLSSSGNITSHGGLQVDGKANFGTQDGKQVTLENGNVYVDGKVASATVETGTLNTTGAANIGTDLNVDGEATFGKTEGAQVTVSDGNVKADGTVTAQNVHTETETVDNSLLVGTVDAQSGDLSSGVKLSANGNVDATGDVNVGKNLNVSGEANFGDAQDNVKIADGVINTKDAAGNTVEVGHGSVKASESVVVGASDGTNVNLGKDGSITSTGAKGSEVKIADGSITVKSTDADGNVTGTVEIKDGTVKADAINVDGIEAESGAFKEKVEVGTDAGKVTIANGNVSALSGEFANSLKLGDEVVSKIDTGTAPVTVGDAGTLATTATIAATVGNAADLTGANLAAATTDDEGHTVKPTVAEHLSALNDSIGNRNFDNNNVIADNDTVTAALDKIDGALGNVAQFAATDDEGEPTYNGFAKGATDVAEAIVKIDAQVGENAKNIGDMNFNEQEVVYGAITATDLTNAVSQVNSKIGSAADLGVDEEGKGTNGISAANTINANIAAVNAAIGDLKNLSKDLKNLTNGTDEAPTTVVAALNNLDSSLGQIHGLADKLGDKYKGNLAAVDANGKSTLEQHLTAIDLAIGNRAAYTNENGSNKYTYTANADTATALTEIASNIGTAADLGENLINGVSASNTVNKNIAAVNTAVGNIADLEDTFYVSDATNLTDAVRILDADMYQLSDAVSHTRKDLKELHHELRAGMAEMAAMSALVPNPRAHGNTSLSLGTGAYSGHGAVAVGGFHHITDNLMLNAGVAWGNSRDASYRMGVTYSF
ncbi:MAG: YadA-like family protein, partial [Alphaproteobacteria bacterium]|nr:YadA-like family protein [Alphaproteobacteria bacterium]